MDLQRRVIEGWHSPSLGQDMPIVTYGHWGHPILLFPTAAADFLENERFGLVGSVAHMINDGRIRVFSINSINKQSWMDEGLPVPEKAGAKPSMTATSRTRLSPTSGRPARAATSASPRPGPASAGSMPPTPCSGGLISSTPSSP